jgi:Peptidase A4 family
MRKLARGAGATVAAISVVLAASVFSAPRAAAAGGPATPGGPMAVAAWRAAGPAAGQRPIASYNWSGYAVARAGLAFRSVQAAFFVPYADCRATPGAAASQWVGLDGLGSSSVEQAGVAIRCAGHKPRYYAWYEMYPKAVRVVFRVHPGNAILAGVRYLPARRKFRLQLRDISTGRQLRRTLRCAASACTRSSAEVISEAPTSAAGQILPLADYRAAGFTGVAVGTARHQGGLRSRWWRTYRIIGVGRTSHQVTQQPSGLYQGRAFGTYWFRGQ